MTKDRAITTFLLLFLTVIIASSVSKLNGFGRQAAAGVRAADGDHSLRKKLAAVKTKQEWDALLDMLPAVDYDAPESDDPETRARRKARNSHYDGRGMVVKNPDTSITLTEVFYEGKELWPLPADESDAIIVGEVSDRRSYLSNDKSGVYTEFTIAISTVLKGDSVQLNRGGVITASRVGGVVRYPSGHRRLYLVSGEGIPLHGGQYVLFLRKDEQDKAYAILTMYELRADDILPVDEGRQFEPYIGQKKSDFLKTIQDKLTHTPQPAPEKE